LKQENRSKWGDGRGGAMEVRSKGASKGEKEARRKEYKRGKRSY